VEAVECLQDWQDCNGRPANKVLSLYSELRQVLRAAGRTLADVAASSKYRPTDFYFSLVQLVIRVGKHNLLTMIIDDMAHQGIPRSLAFYESAMKQLAVQKQHGMALRIYDKLVEDGLDTSAVTYSCLVRFASEVGDLSRAKEFFDKLSSLTTPSIRAYMTILSVHHKRQDWPASLATIRDMKQRGVPVDGLALNVALSTGVAADQVTAVEHLLTEAEGMSPFVPDVVSYNTTLKAFAQRFDYDSAGQILKRMQLKKVAPNAITYNTIMDAAVRAGQPAEAWKRLQEMREQGLKPDKFSCSILVKALMKHGTSLRAEAIDAALALLEEADPCLDKTLRTTLYNNVAEFVVKSELKDSLLKVMSQMRSKQVNPSPALQKSMFTALRTDDAQRMQT